MIQKRVIQSEAKNLPLPRELSKKRVIDFVESSISERVKNLPYLAKS